MENVKNYYVREIETGFVIHKIGKKIPLPFNFIAKQYAKEACEEFNKYGTIAIAAYYYRTKVAGNRNLSDSKYAYEKWLLENYKNFDK